MSIAGTLRAGKANIERKGHAKGDDVWAAGQRLGCCVITSMPPYLADQNTAIILFRRANGISDQESVGNWSDAATKEEVLTAFDKAIALAEQESAAQPPESGEL